MQVVSQSLHIIKIIIVCVWDYYRSLSLLYMFILGEDILFYYKCVISKFIHVILFYFISSK